jgi:hypothetical protein
MRRGTIEGSLVYRAQLDGTVHVFAKWRDSTRRQVMRKLGPAWAQRQGDRWRKRQGAIPDGHLTPHAAAERMREVIDARRPRSPTWPPATRTASRLRFRQRRGRGMSTAEP